LAKEITYFHQLGITQGDAKLSLGHNGVPKQELGNEKKENVGRLGRAAKTGVFPAPQWVQLFFRPATFLLDRHFFSDIQWACP
jgi:hypothetical protein